MPRSRIRQWVRRRAEQVLGSLGSRSEPTRRIDLPPLRPPPPVRRSLAAVIIVWDEGRDLREWLEFHRLAGVEHVYLYDDGSTDDSAAIMQPYVESGFVTYVPWSKFFGHLGQQQVAYAHALSTFGPDWRWMAFIDIDEFLFPVKDETLGSALSRYDDLPAIAVPWHMFGFCGHETRPDGLTVENFRYRTRFPPSATAQRLLHWKSIVDPLAVVGVEGPHFFVLKDGKHGSYTEDRVWIDGPHPDNWERLRSDVFRLNHYFTKSREDFDRRRSGGRDATGRRRPDVHLSRALRNVATIEAEESVEDDLILRYVPELRRILFGPHDQR